MKKFGKKITLLIVFVLILSIAFIGYRWFNKRKGDSYATYIKPRIELSVFKINKFTQKETNMDMQMLVDNPLPVSVKIDSLNYTISIGGVEVIKSTYPKSIHLKGNDSSYISFPVIMKNEVLTNVLKKLENKKADSTDYKIEGNAIISLLTFKNKPYQFSFSKRLPLYIIPKLTVEKVRFKKVGLKHSDIVVSVLIENPNVFPYIFKQTSYKININDNHLVSGNIQDVINIPARGKATITLPADVSLIGAIETKFNSWFRSAKTPYQLYFETKIVADDNSIKDSKVIIEAEGMLKDLKK